MSDLTPREATRAALQNWRNVKLLLANNFDEWKAATEAKDAAALAAAEAGERRLMNLECDLNKRLAEVASAELSSLADAGQKAPPALVVRYKKAKRDGSWSGKYEYRDANGTVVRESQREYRFCSSAVELNLLTGELRRDVGGYGFSSTRQQMERNLRVWQESNRLGNQVTDNASYTGYPKVLAITDGSAS